MRPRLRPVTQEVLSPLYRAPPSAGTAPGTARRKDREHGSTPQVRKAAYLATGWRDADGVSRWTWHSLRHVFCTTALDAWGIEVADVSRLVGHANSRVTFEMPLGSVAGALERARRATD